MLEQLDIMFRIMLAPKATPGKGEIAVFDKIYEEFNTFKVDTGRKVIDVCLTPNVKNGYYDYDRMVKSLTDWWNISKLTYHHEEGTSRFLVGIPEGYEVLVILK